MIKNKTYYNFLRVVKKIEAKGYDRDEAVILAHKVFDNFNPPWDVNRSTSQQDSEQV